MTHGPICMYMRSVRLSPVVCYNDTQPHAKRRGVADLGIRQPLKDNGEKKVCMLIIVF